MSTGHPSIKQSKVNDCVSLKFRTEAQRLKSFKHNLLIVSPLYGKNSLTQISGKSGDKAGFRFYIPSGSTILTRIKIPFNPPLLPYPYHLHLKAGIRHDHRLSGFTYFLIFYFLTESSVYKRAKFLLNFARLESSMNQSLKLGNSMHGFA